MAKIDPSMPLRDLRQEQFARYIATPMGVYEAFCKAGYAPDRKNAKRTAARENVKARVEFLMRPQMEAMSIERDRVIREYAALAFSDITQVMKWQTGFVETEDYADGGETLVVRRIVNHKGEFLPSKDLPPEVRAAIQSVEVTTEGAIKVKMHPKLPALAKLAELLRLIQPAPKDGDEPAPGTGPVNLIQNVFNITPEQARNELHAAFRTARRHAEPVHVIEQPRDGAAAEDA